MIGTRRLGKLNSEKFCSELPRKNQKKKLKLQKSRTKEKITQLQMTWVKQPQVKILMGIKHPLITLRHST